jgi:hypothetical protein
MSEDFEQRLARLATSTAAIRATQGFSRRVLLSIQLEAASGFRGSLSRGVRRFVPVALVFALAAVFWAIDSESAARQAMATSYGVLELEW